MPKAKSFADLGGLVYSTELGKTCPGCKQAVDACTCNDDTVPDGDGIVRVRYERKGRGGKGVTLIDGILETKEELKVIAKDLKKKCGVGGALKENTIEIQGDQRDLIVQLLSDKGYTVKKSGG